MSAPGNAAADGAQAAELAHFGALASGFWDPAGPLRTLHEINPARVGYISARVALAGAQIADVGCGGGLLAESLARLGAQVTAIDLAPEMIEVARLHAAESQLQIDYRVCSLEQLAASAPARFAAVTCMELIEHVAEPSPLFACFARLLVPGGRLLVSTLNRTPSAFFAAIVGGEYLTRLVPRGTHRYDQFRRPSEIARWARAAGLDLDDVSGLRYNPLTRSASIGGSPDVNFLASFTRTA